MQNLLTADIVALANKIAEMISTKANEYLSIGETLNVQRVWAINRNVGQFIGMKVDVYGSRYNRGEPITRGEDNFEAYIVVGIMERYTIQVEESEVPIPTSWIDARVNFVEQAIYNHLQKARVAIDTDGNYEWVCQSAEIVIVADPGKLLEHKVFWSEMELGFSRLKRGEIV